MGSFDWALLQVFPVEISDPVRHWVPGTFTLRKWSLLPPDFKECCIRYS